MYFSKHYTTMWHDTDACHIVRPSRLLEYMQETGHLQCLSVGLDLNDLHDRRGISFILSRLQLSFFKPVYNFDTIEVRTWCSPLKGWKMMRYFQILRDGEAVAEAASEWALVDVIHHTLIRPSTLEAEILDQFPIDEPIPNERFPHRVRIPAPLEMETIGERTIRYSDLDFNRHMNNTRYPDMLCDFLPDTADGKRVIAMSLSYVKEAALGDTVTVHRTLAPDTANTYLIRTTRPDGQVCLDASVTVE